MFKTVRNYLSLVKFSHTVFALPFAAIGYTLGAIQPGNHPDVWLFLKVILCMILARTAAMAFNRWADREIDSKNERTKIREIPSGTISAKAALTLVILSSVLFMLTTYFINSICFYLSPVALLVILGYSYTKRFTWLCHIVLGIGLSLAPIGAYLAVTGVFDWLPLLFSFTVLTWVGGFDVIYALQDEGFDKSEQLHSVPAYFGKKNALIISSFLHLLTIALVITAGEVGKFGPVFWIGAVLFSILIIYQHTLVKPDDLSRVNLAFATTNGIASIVFASFVISELVWK
ncbi:MAG: UbiA family prenyltransferase [Bacteroidetes bacterium]|nr:UbiA family prenyltransferase [Bacteroidota bacterium]MBK6837491.1 UbiA family prenyltransferase [Bacteroidota bacterium]